MTVGAHQRSLGGLTLEISLSELRASLEKLRFSDSGDDRFPTGDHSWLGDNLSTDA